MDAIERFAARAEAFRLWATDGTDVGAPAARQALTHLIALFAAALELPETDSPGDVQERVSDDEWQRVFQSFRRLPVSHYSEVFDPLAVPPSAPGVADVADDLADIYRDVVYGLRAFQDGAPGAVWYWRFFFWEHWGRHAIGATGALRAWLEADGTGW
jgi:hypothetical protein